MPYLFSICKCITSLEIPITVGIVRIPITKKSNFNKFPIHIIYDAETLFSKQSGSLRFKIVQITVFARMQTLQAHLLSCLY